MLATIVTIGSSAFLPAETRTVVWALVLAGWIVGAIFLSGMPSVRSGVVVTDSMVERQGLFVIIVLGEVVVGVVAGLSETGGSVQSIATGLIGLMIGFAYWWSYFDYVGRRLPIDTPPARMRWLLAHLPVTMSIAAAGAAMVSLIEHAGDSSTPEPTSWLLGGAMAVGLVALVVTMRSLRDFERFPSLYQPVSGAMLVAAGVALLVGLWSPVPWLLALTLVLTLAAVWFFAVDRWLRLDDPAAALP